MNKQRSEHRTPDEEIRFEDIMLEAAWTEVEKTFRSAGEAAPLPGFTARFMDRHDIASYDELVARSATEPEWFWEAVVDFLGLPFSPRWRVVRDTSRGHPWATWFVGAGFNLSWIHR